MSKRNIADTSKLIEALELAGAETQNQAFKTYQPLLVRQLKAYQLEFPESSSSIDEHDIYFQFQRAAARKRHTSYGTPEEVLESLIKTIATDLDCRSALEDKGLLSLSQGLAYIHESRKERFEEDTN